MNTYISSSYNLIKLLQESSRTKIEKWQNYQLQKLVQHAFRNTRYYNNLFKKFKLKPENINTINDLQRLPILEKDDIRNNYCDLIPANINNIYYFKSSTGGSTGNPLVFLLDKRSWSFNNANYIINWETMGYNYGERYIALGSSSLYVEKTNSLKHNLYYRLKNKIGLNGINMSNEVCNNYIRIIKSKKIKYIYGYASSIYILAKYILNNNIRLDLRGCFTTSEVLTNLYKCTISEAFQCEVMDCYSAVDGGISAFSLGDRFFKVGYNSIYRIEDLNNEGIGSALITDLFNYAMPFINYKIGDEFMINLAKNHDCSYNGQIINKVLGRSSDIIHLENGKILTGPGFTVLFKDIPVEYYCIEKDGINSIKCSIIKQPSYNHSHDELITSTLKKHMGHDSKLTIVPTKEVKYAPSGKPLYFMK